MNIKLKLLVGFFIIILFIILLGIVAFVDAVDMSKHFEFLVVHDLEVLKNAEKLQKLVVDAETGQRGFIITGNESFLEPYTKGIEDFNSLIIIEYDLVSDNPSQIERLKNIQVLFDEWNIKAAQPEIAAARQFHETDTNFKKIEDMLSKGVGKNILDKMRNEFAIFIQIEVDLKDQRFEQALTIVNNTKIAVVIILIISVIVAVLIALYSANKIAKPIEILTKATDKVAKGNLDTKIKQYDTHDEIGHLSKSFNMMTESLKEKTEKLSDALKEVKKADIQKEEFSAMITHELKTPLAAIIGYSEMLKNQTMGELNVDQKSAINEICDSSDALNSLIGNILTAQKIDQLKLSIYLQPTSLNELLIKTHTRLLPLMIEKQIEFLIFSEDRNITAVDNEFISKNYDVVYVDHNRIMQVFSNLIQNSVDFVLDSGGKIEIRCIKKGSDFLFSIKDNGIGIPPDKLKYLFRKYYQIDTSITRKHGGSGLGLVICKGIIEGHNGKIWAENNDEKGTIIYFTIPIKDT